MKSMRLGDGMQYSQPVVQVQRDHTVQMASYYAWLEKRRILTD